MAMPTLLDLAKKHSSAGDVGLIEEAVKATPELQHIPASFVKGQRYKSLIRTALPTVAFRSANEGSAASRSTWENREFSSHILSSLTIVDQAIADGDEDGPEMYIALQADGSLRGAQITAAKQLYYGTDTDAGGDAKGFPGLVQQHDLSMVVDAGGTTDNTATSVWAVKFGHKDACLTFGGRDTNGGPLKISPVTRQLVTAANGLLMPAYVLSITAWVGFAVSSKFSVARIKCLTEDDGCGLNDDLIAELLSKFPGSPPDALFMTRRSQMQLKNSRTAWNEKGLPAPFPVEALGIPIHVTEAISNTGAIAL